MSKATADETKKNLLCVCVDTHMYVCVCVCVCVSLSVRSYLFCLSIYANVCMGDLLWLRLTNERAGQQYSLSLPRSLTRSLSFTVSLSLSLSPSLSISLSLSLSLWREIQCLPSVSSLPSSFSSTTPVPSSPFSALLSRQLTNGLTAALAHLNLI